MARTIDVPMSTDGTTSLSPRRPMTWRTASAAANTVPPNSTGASTLRAGPVARTQRLIDQTDDDGCGQQHAARECPLDARSECEVIDQPERISVRTVRTSLVHGRSARA